MDESRITRRHLIEGAVAVPLVVALAACGDDDGGEGAAERATTAQAEPDGTLPATPACDDGDDPTPEQTEGPYFLPRSPERKSLIESGVRGDRLVVTGRVLGTDCKPVARALLDFWQADGEGEYDLEGFRLRGHQFTDSRGRFRLATVVPGLYPGRTRHIHVKAQRPRGTVLTTQLYFRGEPQNDSDGLFDPALLMAGSGGATKFDFVLAMDAP
jgi:protocatechuate 3,4-dioxygenase beta subunit